MTEETKKLTPAQYWEWRFKAEQIKLSHLNEKRVNLEQEIMNKDIETKKLKLALFRETVKASRRSTENNKKEFEETKQRIEKELGISLENCAIDPYTLEVKQVD